MNGRRDTLQYPYSIQCWRTSDGKIFEVYSLAVRYEKEIRDLKIANDLLDQGKSIGEALDAIDYPGKIDTILYRVTKHTKMVISYIRLYDDAVYQPIYFKKGFRVWVSGYTPESVWTGDSVTLENLAQYAKNERTEKLMEVEK